MAQATGPVNVSSDSTLKDTRILRADAAAIAEAASVLRAGGLAAFPTETVYGLGANVFDAAAVARIFDAKKRPNDNPLIAHVGALDQIGLLAREITPAARKFVDAFFPAPLTLVLPKTPEVPHIATAGLDTIGVRVSAGVPGSGRRAVGESLGQTVADRLARLFRVSKRQDRLYSAGRSDGNRSRIDGRRLHFRRSAGITFRRGFARRAAEDRARNRRLQSKKRRSRAQSGTETPALLAARAS